jgi:hypothetical protein
LKLIDLENAVRQHAGEFLCESMNDRQITKRVQFAHVVTPPLASSDLPVIGRLQDFYDTFGSVVFYSDEKSGDAAKHLAPTSEWAALHEYFYGWIENLSDAERQEIVPDWIETCLVIGETPCSGNYILMGTEGPAAGRVFEFDHDGFEFSEVAQDLIEYVEKLLRPDGPRLVEFASHMRFIEDDPGCQWWIRELSDHQGHIVTTDA